MSLLNETKYLLKRYKLRPDTNRGQNFLISEKILNQIIKAAELSKKDIVLEIGTGLGTMTAKLADRADKVISFETDKRLSVLLNKLSSKYDNLDIITRSFLKVNFTKLLKEYNLTGNGSYKVVANIPYYITGKLLSAIMVLPALPSMVLLLVQKEVGEKIVAKPGDYSKQSLAVQFYGHPVLVGEAKAKDFWPVPEIDSVILKIEDLHHWNYNADEQETWKLIKIGFSSKRKKLANNLAAGLQQNKAVTLELLDSCGLDLNIRAEDLTLKQWLGLTSEWIERNK